MMRTICTLALVGLVSLAAFAAAGPLDGSSWVVKVTPDEKSALKGEEAFDDTLTFAEGKVSMSECLKVGFAASDYSAKAAGSKTMFSTEQVSAAEGKSHWKAEIHGETIKGTLIWTKSDGTVVRYTFEGKKQ